MASGPRGEKDWPRATERSTARSITLTTVGSLKEYDGSSERVATGLREDAGLDARSSCCPWSETGTSVPVPDDITYTAMERPEIKRTKRPPALMLRASGLPMSRNMILRRRSVVRHQ